MPQVHVLRSTTIDAPVETVFAEIRDFKKWPVWSPWLICEPECEVTYTDDGKAYDWEGAVVGSGGMVIRDEQENKRIDYDLNFLKPFKSYADVSFLLEAEGSSTKISWTMDTKLPFFLFFMKNMMAAFIGMDYDRGLMMLKSLLETGRIPSKLDHIGIEQFPGTAYVGVRRLSAIDKLGNSMGECMEKVRSTMEKAGLEASGNPFSIYHKWNPAKNLVDFSSCVPVADASSEPPDGLLVDEIPPTPVFKIKHTGEYDYLGNAWSSGVCRSRNKIFRQNNKIHPFETYENKPGNTPGEELVTVVHFPVKA